MDSNSACLDEENDEMMTEKEKMELPLLPNYTYRISHEGNNSGLIFYSKANYNYFLKKYFMYCGCPRKSYLASEGVWLLFTRKKETL